MVPASGNLWIGGQQVWLGPALSGRQVTLWVDAISLHVLLDGARIKTLPSRLGATELARLATHGVRPAGPSPLPTGTVGVAAGQALAPALARRHLAAAFSSPLSRAMRTAELVGLTGVKPDPDLLEWDYGGYEGMTAAQIRQTRPGWYLWRDGVIPGDAGHPGEHLQQVAGRTDAVLDRARPLLDDGDVALVAHGHLLRVLTARWLGLDPSAGRLFRHPAPGTLSALGTEHEQTVISAWNVP